MEIVDRKRDESISIQLSEVVDNLVSLITELSYLNGWWYKEYGKYKRIYNKMMYETYINILTKPIQVLNLEQQNIKEIIDLNLVEPKISDFDYLHGNIDLIYENASNYSIYRFTKNSTSLLGITTTILFPKPIVFEYPPKSFASILFYMLNPKIENIVRKIAKQYIASEEDHETLNIWENVYKRIIETKIDKEITSPFRDLTYKDGLTSKINIAYSSRYKVLSSINTTLLYDKHYKEICKMFSVSFNKKNEYIMYYMITKSSIIYILDAMLPQSEIKNLSEDTQYILSIIRKVPVLIKTLENLDNEWFIKHIDLFSDSD
ncbi:MAG: hypothetical protein QXK24_06965 [Ignisphaera sp.]|uniref:Uncharacterized protein n=1 Tax=Ignisphaera aggregans TaxID=334771 RepID=A0A7C4D078_9CREN